MPELPTREELAALIHAQDCHSGQIENCDWWPDGCVRGVHHTTFALVAADAVLHRLMRDADTEPQGQALAYRVKAAESCLMTAIQTALDDKREIVRSLLWTAIDCLRGNKAALAEVATAWTLADDRARANASPSVVTFTGEWEPAGAADKETT